MLHLDETLDADKKSVKFYSMCLELIIDPHHILYYIIFFNVFYLSLCVLQYLTCIDIGTFNDL